jgi:hypothetical protein
MFSKAVESAMKYTKPIVVSTRTIDGRVDSSCGAYVIINEDGWIITAAHIFQLYVKHFNDRELIADYTKKVKAIEDDESFDAKHKRKKINKIIKDRDWLTNASVWLGDDSYKIDKITFDERSDIAIAKIINFDKSAQKEYPKFIKPEKIKTGTFLCKLGFPFPNLTTEFIEEKNAFSLSPVIAYFPLEGMFTRNIQVIDNEGKVVPIFIETSTPGLRGQSGGPIFDKSGSVVAIQSQTVTMPLDFQGKVKRKGKEIEEDQFINVGYGAHPIQIRKILTENNIAFLDAN